MIARRSTLRSVALVLVALLAMLPFPSSKALAEPIDPALVLSTLKESLRRAPLAERVRVTIKPLGKTPRSDEFLVKVDPGRKPDHSDAAVWIELGDLRVYAGGGRMIAVHTGDETSCYTVEYGEHLRADTLRKLLPPIPAPLVALMLPDDPAEPPNVSSGLTPYTPRITWASSEVSGGPAAEVVTLTGTRDAFPGERPQEADTRVTLTIDARTSRPSRFSAFLPDAAELKLDFTPTVPGNPATWPIRDANRTKVASLTELQPRRGDAATAHVVPELTLMDANWTNWDHRSVFRRNAASTDPAPTHLVLIFVRESSRDAFGAPLSDAKAAEEELRKLEAEFAAAPAKDDAPAIRLRHLVIPVMLTMDDTSRRKVEQAVKLRADAGGIGGNIVWASSPERTIERFAPGAAAVGVIVRADNSLAGIVLLDGRAKDGKSLRDDFRRALGLVEAPKTPG